MAEATSRTTRALIKRAVEAGAGAEEMVQRFCRDGRQAMVAFDKEVNPLGLSDLDYRRVVEASGLDQVHAFARQIGDAVEALQTGRAA